MRATKLASALGCSALLLGALASAPGAQEYHSERAPVIRIYSTNGSYVLNTTSYVTPVIDLSEDAYVFAVSMDLDGQIRVLHPDFPGISVRLQSRKQLRLPNFFAGFGARDEGNGYYSAAGYSRSSNYGNDARGTVIALASRAPFNFSRIERNGDWNVSSIRRLIENRDPEAAAQALASYLGGKDEPIGWDYMRFAGGQNYNNAYAYGYSAYSPCAFYSFDYQATLASRYFQASSIIGALRARGQQARVFYDMCGFPYVVVRSSSPSSPVGGFPGVRPKSGDTSSVIPVGRFPRGTPRHPIVSGSKTSAPERIFPLPQREGQMADVTISAPRARRSEPIQTLQGYRPSPGTSSAPEGRLPIERVTTPRLEPAASTGGGGGGQPTRESRPEPRSAPPPPSRVPDASPRPAPSPPPAPVVREAPSSRQPEPRSEPLRPVPSKQ